MSLHESMVIEFNKKILTENLVEFLTKHGFHLDEVSRYRRRGVWVEFRAGCTYSPRIKFVTEYGAVDTVIEMMRRIEEKFPVATVHATAAIENRLTEYKMEMPKPEPPDHMDTYTCPSCETEHAVFYIKGRGFWCSHCNQKAPAPHNPEMLRCECGKLYYLRPHCLEYDPDPFGAKCEDCKKALFGDDSKAVHLDAYGNPC